MCFGFCLRKDYSPVSANEPLESTQRKARPASSEPAAPKKPRTDWRDIPLVTNYHLLNQIGKGGFATIWLAENKATGETVALKVVQLTDPDLEPEEVATLLAEARFLRSLDCPYIIKCHETAASDEWLVLVLEYLSGGEMLDHIHKVKKYTEAEAAKLFAQVVSAISYLHNLNLMHRDIKPENVMFTGRVEDCEAEGRSLRVKVIDLGMSAVYDPEKEIRGCIGTPGFVAPELWNDGPHTPAADVYSLGVVLFIMLTGRKPHSGADIRMMTYCNKSIKDAPGLQDERFLALSSAARELLLAMLADAPRDRPTCLAVLRHAFIAAVDSNAEAHREMGEEVRRRMRDLNKIRRVHGLRFALRVNKPQGADHQVLLEALERRRLQLKRNIGGFHRVSDAQSAFECPSLATDVIATAGGGGVPTFAKCSLATSYAMPPAYLMPPSRVAAATHPPPASAPATTSATPGPHPGREPPTGGTLAGLTGIGAVSAQPCPPQPSLPPLPAAAPAPCTAPTAAVAQPPGPLVSPFASLSHGPLGQAAAAGAARGGLPHVAVRPRPGRNSAPGLGPLASTSMGTVTSPDVRSHDMCLPVPESLAARPPGGEVCSPEGPRCPPWGQLPSVGAAPAAVGPSSQHRPPLPSLDPMALVNVLPTLEHCMSMGGLRLSEAGEDRPGGGSPAATKEMVDEALLAKCMSANQYTLELLARQNSIQRALELLAVEPHEELPLPAAPAPFATAGPAAAATILE